MEKLGVVLGRFAPMHKGHQLLINKLISDFGINNSLIIIGSSKNYNERTPFGFADRKKIIKKIYPKIKIIGLPDINPKLIFHNPETDNEWINNIKKLERKINKKFIFYGGSSKDLYYIKNKFKKIIPINRNTEGLNISATKIRNLLTKNENEELKKYLDPKIISLAITSYKKFIEQFK